MHGGTDTGGGGLCRRELQDTEPWNARLIGILLLKSKEYHNIRHLQTEQRNRSLIITNPVNYIRNNSSRIWLQRKMSYSLNPKNQKTTTKMQNLTWKHDQTATMTTINSTGLCQSCLKWLHHHFNGQINRFALAHVFTQVNFTRFGLSKWEREKKKSHCATGRMVWGYQEGYDG